MMARLWETSIRLLVSKALLFVAHLPMLGGNLRILCEAPARINSDNLKVKNLERPNFY